MAVLKFKMKDVKKVVAELEQAKEFTATYEDLYEPSNYPGGVLLDENGHSESHLDFKWPDSDKMIPNILKPSLILAKDQGIYLVSNAKDLEGTPSERGTVAYCEGCHPDHDEDWYENSRYLYGGDDGADKIPLLWFQMALKANKRIFKIQITNTSMRVML